MGINLKALLYIKLKSNPEHLQDLHKTWKFVRATAGKKAARDEWWFVLNSYLIMSGPLADMKHSFWPMVQVLVILETYLFLESDYQHRSGKLGSFLLHG